MTDQLQANHCEVDKGRAARCAESDAQVIAGADGNEGDVAVIFW
jgi:hypothetical protein